MGKLEPWYFLLEPDIEDTRRGHQPPCPPKPENLDSRTQDPDTGLFRTDQGRAISFLLMVSCSEINQTMLECPTVRHSVTICLWSAVAPFTRLSHCGIFSTWVCPRFETRKGNALNTTPGTKSQTNNLISYFFSTRFDTFQNWTYSTLAMPKRKSAAGEVAVAEARPRRSLRNAQPASEPEPVAASAPAAKEAKKVQPKNAPKAAAVKRGGRKTPQKVEEESVGFFFILASGWKGLFSSRQTPCLSPVCDINT